MACIHNQAKINSIIKEINVKQNKIDDLKANITKSNEIKEKHQQFNNKLQCVMENLNGNYVEAGKTYDGGKMLKCSVDTMKTIKDCESIILESGKSVKTLENEIRSLKQQMANLNGDCFSCTLSNPTKQDGAVM